MGLSAEDTDPRGQFLDDVSHELRMPLTALKGQMQLMQRRLRREPEREDDLLDLAKMLYQVQRLNGLFDPALVPGADKLAHFGVETDGVLGQASRVQVHQPA